MDDEKEHQANAFAEQELLPKKAFTAFTHQALYSKDAIMHFAREIGIAPGIVVGRLQNDGLLEPSWHNDLRQRFEWCALSVAGGEGS